MVYAKQVKDGEVVALLTYNYTPKFGEGSATVIITAEEYAILKEEWDARPKVEVTVPTVTERPISDSEALAIITD